MKGIRQVIVGAVLAGGLISCAQAHVFVGVGVGMAPVMPMVPVAPMVPVPVYAPPPPVYYGPPPPVYVAPPVVIGGYWGHPHGYYRGYYGYGYRY